MDLFAFTQELRLLSCKQCTLNRTISSMMKLIFLRALASQYTMTSMGKGLKYTKMKFDNSSACTLIERKYNGDYSLIY